MTTTTTHRSLSIKEPEMRVLNDSEKTVTSIKSAVDASKDLQKLMLKLKGNVITEDGRGVDYEKLKSSALFDQYLEQAAALRFVNLRSLSDKERTAFFINVYNALTIHGLTSCDQLPSSVLNVQLFWKTTAYNIGGHVYSLDDIEHGVLRGNRPHPASKAAPFGPSDPRLQEALQLCDPRIHFALVCGAKSCPAIQVYTADNLEKALDGAARSFCRQEVKVYEMQKEIHVSKILQWYKVDFGENDVQAIRWTIPYLEEASQQSLNRLLHTLEEHGMVDIVYRDYDWNLNKVSSPASCI